MRSLIIAVAGTAILAGTAFAQNTGGRVLDQPKVGEPQVTSPSTATTGSGVIRVPGEGNPYGAQGGAIPGVPNPDRVPANTPGGQTSPPSGGSGSGSGGR
jgi:hypothetical protein